MRVVHKFEIHVVTENLDVIEYQVEVHTSNMKIDPENIVSMADADWRVYQKFNHVEFAHAINQALGGEASRLVVTRSYDKGRVVTDVILE